MKDRVLIYKAGSCKFVLISDYNQRYSNTRRNMFSRVMPWRVSAMVCPYNYDNILIINYIIRLQSSILDWYRYIP
jgi:hypothetical protein